MSDLGLDEIPTSTTCIVKRIIFQSHYYNYSFTRANLTQDLICNFKVRIQDGLN